MTEVFAGPLGPLLIFAFRIIDVSLATVRLLLTMRNVRSLVPLIGFFESLIWVLAAGTVIRNLQSPLHLVGYAAGFASGTVVGLWIEGKLAVGLATIRIISRDVAVGEAIADSLRRMGHGVTEFAGQGRQGKVNVIYTLVRRRQAPTVVREVERMDGEAFISVDEPRAIHRGWMLGQRKS